MASPTKIVPTWLQLVMDQEVKCSAPKKLLKNDGRKTIWVLCAMMRVSSLGIPGQACRLFERYLTERIRAAGPALQSTEGKRRFMAELSSQVVLAMATCIQLASKMASATLALSSKFTRNYLSAQNVLHTTISEINHMEIVIYKILDYQIPKYTSVDIAQLLAAEIGLPMAVMKDIGLLIDLAEYNRYMLEKIMQRDFKQPDSDVRDLSTLHLAAGSVAAVAKQHADFTAASLDRLADLTNSTAAYIECIVKVILTFLMPLPYNEDVPSKKFKID